MMIHLPYPYANLALGLALFSGACSGPIKPGEEPVAELHESEAASECSSEVSGFQAKRIEFLRAERARFWVVKRCVEGAFEHLPYTKEDEERDWNRAREEFRLAKVARAAPSGKYLYHGFPYKVPLREKRWEMPFERRLPTFESWEDEFRAEEEAMGPLSNFDKYQRPNPWVICIVPQSERDPKAIAKSKFMFDCERYNLKAVGLMASEWLSQWWVDQDDAGIQEWLNSTKRGMNLNDWKDFRDSRKMAIYRDLCLWDQRLRVEENAAGVSTPPLLWADPLVTKLFERMKDESESCGSEGAR